MAPEIEDPIKTETGWAIKCPFCGIMVGAENEAAVFVELGGHIWHRHDAMGMKDSTPHSLAEFFAIGAE